MPSPLADLEADVLSEVSKCSGPLARKALADTTVRFYKETLCKNVTLDLIPISVDTAEYTLVNPSGYQIISPRYVEFDQKPLTQTSEDALDLNWSELSLGASIAWPAANASGVDRTLNWRAAASERPWLYYCPNPNVIRLVGIPNTVPTVGLNVNVYVHPTKDVTQIDDWIYNSWNDALILGAIAQLKQMKEKTFYDPRGAAAADEAFLEKAGELAGASIRSHTRNNRTHLRTKVWS